jgi:hypothetical protein
MNIDEEMVEVENLEHGENRSMMMDRSSKPANK